MTEPWSSGDLPPGQGACSPVTLIEGSTFCISEPGGDIVPDRSQGLFVRDTRVLSRWELTVVDRHGSYAISGLTPGDYVLCFGNWSSVQHEHTPGYQAECYDHVQWDGVTNPA